MSGPANTQTYPGLLHFTDLKQQQALRFVWDRIHSLEGRPEDTGITFRANPNLGGHPASTTKGLRITNAADPVDPGDYVTKRYADITYAGPGLQAQLQIGSDALANVLPDPIAAGNTGITAGLHGLRPDATAAATQGHPFYIEIDRQAIYQSIQGVWNLVATYVMEGQTGDLPSDLGGADAGFYFFDITTGVMQQWSGAIWHYHSGIMRGLFSARPTAFVGSDAGLIYAATDRGYQAWVLDFATGQWVLLEGWGGPMVGALGSKPSLTANDAGFRYHANDFDREYRWNGSGWADAPGQPSRGMLGFFNSTSPGTGWGLCNGGAVTMSTSSGGTTSFTTPVMAAGYFVRGNSGYGGTGGQDAQSIVVSPAAATTSDENNDIEVQAGTGTFVAADTHQHTVTVPPTTVGFDNQPAYVDWVPYVRL